MKKDQSTPGMVWADRTSFLFWTLLGGKGPIKPGMVWAGRTSYLFWTLLGGKGPINTGHGVNRKNILSFLDSTICTWKRTNQHRAWCGQVEHPFFYGLCYRWKRSNQQKTDMVWAGRTSFLFWTLLYVGRWKRTNQHQT